MEIFFFQAEDGIRHPLWSRGIGDGYKRKIVGGGTIPEEDKNALEKSGVTGNFGPGTSLDDVISHIKKGVSKLRKL